MRNDVKAVITWVLLIAVGFLLGVFTERRSTVGRLQRVMQEQIADIDLRLKASENQLFGYGPTHYVTTESLRSLCQDIQVLQGQVGDMQERLKKESD